MDPYLEFRTVTGSTNDDVRERLREGCAHGYGIFAGAQRNGRGRLGRPWHAPDSGNLYLSVALTDDAAQAELSALPFVAAIAVAQWLRDETSIQFGLKWPNDVLVGHRKLAGILCEGATTSHGRPGAVVGIGLNLNATLDDFPAELREIVTTVREETGREFDREAVARALRSRVVRWYETLVQTGSKAVFDRWLEHEDTLGRRVTIVESDLEGIAHDLDRDGALLVRLDDGTIRRVHAGDVRFELGGNQAGDASDDPISCSRPGDRR